MICPDFVMREPIMRCLSTWPILLLIQLATAACGNGDTFAPPSAISAPGRENGGAKEPHDGSLQAKGIVSAPDALLPLQKLCAEVTGHDLSRDGDCLCPRPT